MTRRELRVLSDAFAVAHVAMAAPETRIAPMSAALVLAETAATELPTFAGACNLFHERLRQSHGRLDEVSSAGRALRDAVAAAMAFVPVDLHRVDIHA